jgi:hypothetical protein
MRRFDSACLHSLAAARRQSAHGSAVHIAEPGSARATLSALGSQRLEQRVTQRRPVTRGRQHSFGLGAVAPAADRVSGARARAADGVPARAGQLLHEALKHVARARPAGGKAVSPPASGPPRGAFHALVGQRLATHHQALSRFCSGAGRRAGVSRVSAWLGAAHLRRAERRHSSAAGKPP